MGTTTIRLLFGLLVLTALGCGQSIGDRQVNGSPRQFSLRAEQRGPDFVTLAKALQPAVVNVSASVAPPPVVPPGARQPQQDDPTDDMLDKFFGVPPPAAPAPQRQQGSGFIIGADGIILTNAHVVERAKRIIVKLGDKREFEAKVLGKDAPTDIAVLKIAVQENLPTIGLGDSDHLEVGEWVMAVGNPFGLDNSVSSGIVSGKGRHIGEAYDHLIQTDAPLNPGSSGGPLINLNGQVVGVNKAIVSETGGSIGISFATPINSVKEILPELQTKGKVTRGWAGLSIQEMTSALADTLGLQKPSGALVAGIVKGGPAERGGIKLGDVITKFDGRPVTDALDLPMWIARTPIAKRVRLTVYRDQRNVDVDLTIAELPDRPMELHGKEIG
ncbi:MAG TPA: trypsin-like peptidase domain-containing protein [Candidatus Binatia bacterium]